MGRRSKYPEDFRQRAAQLVLDSRRSVRNVAAELGINHETLRNWGPRRGRNGPQDRRHSARTSGWSWRGCGARWAELDLEREMHATQNEVSA